MLQKERLTRDESTKSGCGVVEQFEKSLESMNREEGDLR